MTAQEKKSENAETQEAPNERLGWRVREYCVNQRISPSTFYKYRALGKIRTINIGGRVLVPSEEASRIAREGF